MVLVKQFIHLLKILIFGLMKLMSNPMYSFEYDIEVRERTFKESKEKYSASKGRLDITKDNLKELEKEIKSIEALLESKKLDKDKAYIKAHRLISLKTQSRLLASAISRISDRLEKSHQKLVDLMLDIEARKIRLDTYKSQKDLNDCGESMQDLDKCLRNNNVEKELKDSLRFEEHKQDSYDTLSKELNTSKDNIEQHEISELLSTYGYNDDKVNVEDN